MHFARKSISANDSAYLVEGYADVLSMHQAGVENVISSSGTSLTKGQIRLVSRYTQNIVLLFDGDAAGIKAALRGTDLLLEEGLNVKILLFPDGDDPDSYIKKKGSEEFKKFIEEHTEDFIFFKTRVLLDESGNDPIKKAGVIREIVSSIALIPDQIKTSLFIRQCSTLLDIEERILLTELNKLKIDRSKKQFKGKQESRTPNEQSQEERLLQQDINSRIEQKHSEIDSEILIEREVIRILLNYGHEIAYWEEGEIPVAPLLLKSIEDINFVDPASAKIITHFRDKMKNFNIPHPKDFFSHEDKGVSELVIDCIANKYELSENWNDEKRQIYVTREIEHLKDLVIQAVYRIKKRKIQLQIDSIREELKEDHSEEDLSILLSKYQILKEAEKGLALFLGNTIIK